MPAQVPTMSGPANVCVRAQTLDPKKPIPSRDTTSRAISTARLSKSETGSITVESKRPDAINPFRTSLGGAPCLIQRSESHPPSKDVMAEQRNGTDPQTAIEFIE